MIACLNELILATGNTGKIHEFQNLLAPLNCIAQQELGISAAEETGLSFIENAILKARHASRIGQKPALADDSGLVVNALAGTPGIYSARFAGVNATALENTQLLLERLQDIEEEAQRQAYFYCALALVEHENDPTPIIAVGRLDGLIAKASCGEKGFGYDPVFYLPEYQCTAAELPLSVKNKISHRAIAFQQLLQQLL